MARVAVAGFEDLIRSALRKQGDATQADRAKIYRSSLLALERMVTNNASLDEAGANLQRERLHAAIRGIESDYLEKSPSAEPPAPSTPSAEPVRSEPVRSEPLTASRPSPSPAQWEGEASAVRTLAPTPAPVVVPSVPESDPGDGLVADRASRRRQPAFSEPVGTAADDVYRADDDYDDSLLQGRRPFAKLLLWAIVLAGLGTVAWWAFTFGPDLLKNRTDGSVANPPTLIEDGSFVPESERGWTRIFDPAANAQDIDVSAGGTAEVATVDGAPVARVASRAGGDANDVRIRVPRGIMQNLQGNAATFEITVSSGSEEPQQFLLSCEFGAMGDCGRKRYTAPVQRAPFVFEVLVNDVMLDNDQNAYIALNTDASSKGASLDVHSLRVRASR